MRALSAAPAPAPTVFVVDDDPSVRAALDRLLRTFGYVVQTFADTREVFAGGRPPGPACMILDLQMPDVDGLRYQQLMKQLGIRIPIVFVTGRGNIPNTVTAMRAGALDFLPKPFDTDQLVDVVRRGVELDAALLTQEREQANLRRRFETLTPRERQVLFAVADGMLNKQVGAELGVCEKTIKVHRSRVMEKLGIVSVVDLVRIADLLRPVPEILRAGVDLPAPAARRDASDPVLTR